jgi:hypothetical protein
MGGKENQKIACAILGFFSNSSFYLRIINSNFSSPRANNVIVWRNGDRITTRVIIESI